MCLTPHQHCEMLESDPTLAGIFYEMHISWGHEVDELGYRPGRDNGIGSVDDCYRRAAEGWRSDDFTLDPKRTAQKRFSR